MKKRFKAICMAVVMLCAIVAAPVSASAQAPKARYELPFDLNVASYLLVSLDTGEVIFEKDADVARTPASLTKLMTSYIALKYVDDLDGTMVKCTTPHTDEVFVMGGSHADIRPGETVSMRNLIYAMLLPSANEAANMVASYIGNGSRSNFYMIMN